MYNSHTVHGLIMVYGQWYLQWKVYLEEAYSKGRQLKLPKSVEYREITWANKV